MSDIVGQTDGKLNLSGWWFQPFSIPEESLIILSKLPLTTCGLSDSVHSAWRHNECRRCYLHEYRVYRENSTFIIHNTPISRFTHNMCIYKYNILYIYMICQEYGIHRNIKQLELTMPQWPSSWAPRLVLVMPQNDGWTHAEDAENLDNRPRSKIQMVRSQNLRQRDRRWFFLVNSWPLASCSILFAVFLWSSDSDSYTLLWIIWVCVCLDQVYLSRSVVSFWTHRIRRIRHL